MALPVGDVPCWTGPMKPEPALVLVTAVIAAVAPYLPGRVRTVRARVVPVWGLQIWAVPADVPVEEDYDF